MADITVQDILAQVEKLSLNEQFELAARLQARAVEIAGKMRGRLVAANLPFNDRAREHQWLRENQHRYSGQWVALEGDRLIAHGAEAAEVFAAAKAQGFTLPLVFFIEPGS